MTIRPKSNLSYLAGVFVLCSLTAACSYDSKSTETDDDGGSSANGGSSNDGGESNGDSSSDGGGDTSGENGSDAGPPTTPSVVSHSPAEGAQGVALNSNISMTFSEAMDPNTLTSATFTLRAGSSASTVAGTVIYADKIATFWPAAFLTSGASYTASLSTGAKSQAGIPVETATTFSFETGDALAAVLPVRLGTAGNFVILSKSGISTVPTSVVTGNLGVSPIDSTAITGFSLSADASNVFSTSKQVTGKIYAANYAKPTPSNLTTAISDMEIAFTDAASRAPDKTELGAGNIGGMTLAPGVYKWGTGVTIPTSLALNGDANAVWVFQIAKGLTVSSAVKVTLTGGALPKNVFWQVAGAVDLGTTSHFEGIVLSKTAITLRTGASINGRLLAQTAVKLDGSTVKQP